MGIFKGIASAVPFAIIRDGTVERIWKNYLQHLASVAYNVLFTCRVTRIAGGISWGKPIGICRRLLYLLGLEFGQANRLSYPIQNTRPRPNHHLARPFGLTLPPTNAGPKRVFTTTTPLKSIGFRGVLGNTGPYIFPNS